MSEDNVKYTEGGEKLIIASNEDSENVAKLYEAYETLENLGDKAGENKQAYKTLLQGTKKSQKCKNLAAQFISKFFKYFDALQKEALDSYLDLFEEDSSQIRLTAIKGVSQICKDKPEYVLQMANVLGQLLLDEDVESAVTEVLINLLEIDTVATVTALLQHATSQDDKELRSKAIVFLRSKIVSGSKRDLVLSNTAVEKLLTDEMKPLLGQLEGDDFNNALYILKGLPRFQKEEGSKELLHLLLENTSVDIKHLDANNEEAVQKFLAILPLVNQLARAGADHSDVWNTLMFRVVPNYASYEPEVILRVFQCVAEASAVVNREEAKNAIGPIYEIIRAHLPIPEEGEEPEYNFSFLEPLLISFHNCGYKAPGCLNPVCGIKIFTGQPDEDTGDYSEKREDMIKRVSLFLSKTQAYHKRYKEQKLDEPPSDATEEEQEQFILEKKQASMRNRLLSNLKNLTVTLLGTNPRLIPAFKEIAVSWRPPRKNKGIKRKRGPQDGTSKSTKFQRSNTGSRGGRGGRGGRGASRGGRGRR